MSKENNILQIKSYQFALNIISICKTLTAEKEFIFARQLLKSGTSIGANVEEAIGAQTKKDFIAKISIAYKETRETNYWLRLLKDASIIKEGIASLLLKDSEELLRISVTVLKSAKASLL